MKSRVFATVDEFRQAAQASPDTPITDARVRSSFDTEVKAADDGSRTLTFTISTAAIDRYGDTIAVDGWQLDAYRKNPVVLWAHDSTSLPVAKSEKIWIEAGKLKSDALFTPSGMARFNDTVYDMYVGGFLSAVSVGFLPLKYAFVDDPSRRYGIDFLEQELMEYSCVTVPANAEALIEGKAAGIDVAPMLDWAEDQLKRAAAAGDHARIVKLADSVLGNVVRDPIVIAWAQRIADAGDLLIQSRSRVERIERAAKQKRLAESRRRELDLIRARGS